MPDTYKVVVSLYASTFKELTPTGRGKSPNNTILMGSFVKLLPEETAQWQKVIAFSIEGWIAKTSLGDSAALKCFYVDVGQGDAALLEVGNDQNGLKILIDGGPGSNLSRYLSKWQYKYYFDRDEQVHFDYVFVSHFDRDHYNGLIDIINDEHYTFGTIFHNGIAKFDKDKSSYPDDYNTTLGKRVEVNDEKYLVTRFNSISELEELKTKGGMQLMMENFLSAVKNAKANNRLSHFKRLDHTGSIPPKEINGKMFSFDVLGPVLTQVDGEMMYAYWEDDAHTVNGHSLVLKISYGSRSLLFGGDLNIPSENHLLNHYGDANPFEVDIAKSCHHGASEFTTDFMAKVNPLATVISSGDNETYSHPRADAIGCAGKYTKSERPLVFSTELARSSNVETDEIKFGMINLRCDGEKYIMAQMKEGSSAGKVWDLYDPEDPEA